MTKKEAAEAVRAAKARLGVTWAQVAEAVGRPVAWTTSALLGQHPMTEDEARAAGSVLELGDDVQLGVSLLIYLLIIDPARSGQLLAEAIACTERSGDHLINSFLHNNAGFHALTTGDITAARAHLEAAEQAGQQVGFEDTMAMVGLGVVLRAEGDRDGARSTLESALRVSRRNGDSRSMASAILNLACLAGDAGDWDRAAALHGIAQAFLDRVSNQWAELAARHRRDSLDRARARLGDEQLDRAYARGMALSPDKALGLALPRAGPA